VLLSPSACYEIPVIPYSISIPGAISEFIADSAAINFNNNTLSIFNLPSIGIYKITFQYLF
jgi:hypothetical protein